MSVRKKMKAELRMSDVSCGIHVSAKVLLVTSPHLSPHLSLFCLFPPGGHESKAGQQPAQESE